MLSPVHPDGLRARPPEVEAAIPRVILLKVVPKSSRNRIVGWVGDRLKVQVTAPPEKGKANAAVIEALADRLGISRSEVRITSGETSPLKTVEIDGDDVAWSRLPEK